MELFLCIHTQNNEVVDYIRELTNKYFELKDLNGNILEVDIFFIDENIYFEDINVINDIRSTNIPIIYFNNKNWSDLIYKNIFIYSQIKFRYGKIYNLVKKNEKIIINNATTNFVYSTEIRNNQISDFFNKYGVSNKKLDLTNKDLFIDGYGSTFIENDDTNIPSYQLNEIMDKYNMNFNVLVADCEGFLEVFFDENPTFYDNLRMIIFEADYTDKCNYDKIKNTLAEKKFTKILEDHQNVWIKL